VGGGGSVISSPSFWLSASEFDNKSEHGTLMGLGGNDRASKRTGLIGSDDKGAMGDYFGPLTNYSRWEEVVWGCVWVVVGVRMGVGVGLCSGYVGYAGYVDKKNARRRTHHNWNL
jgi:hypothetical protein